jgi:hypothetical protein
MATQSFCGARVEGESQRRERAIALSRFYEVTNGASWSGAPVRRHSLGECSLVLNPLNIPHAGEA